MYKNNLWRAILAVMNVKSLPYLILNLDRLINALAAGDHRATVSGRVGFFSLTKPNKYWKFLEWIIDETFRPLEGIGHCFDAYMWESERSMKHRRGNDIALGLLCIFIIIGCPILAPIVWVWAQVKKLFPS